MRFTLVLLALLLFACRDAAAPPATHTPDRPDQMIGGTVVPQSHDFPVGRAAEIRRIFEGNTISYPVAVMSKEGAQTQFVNPKPIFIGDHRFVVGLPPASHVALDKLIAGLGKATSPVGATYELTFWLVEAAVAPDSQVAPDLAEVAPMLEKLTALGKRKFKSLDRVSSRTREGARTKLDGRIIKADHRLDAGPDGIELDITMEARTENAGDPRTIQTTLHLPLDQPIVIGDSASASTLDGAANLVLYVVRAKRVD